MEDNLIVRSWDERRLNHKVAKPGLRPLFFTSGTDFRVGDFRNVDFYVTEVKRFDFRKCAFYAANLQGADLSFLNFRGSDFTRANLQGADLSYANLLQCGFENADLTGANLKGTILDPDAKGPLKDGAWVSAAKLECRGFKVIDGYAYGFRTVESSHVEDPVTGKTIKYYKGKTYKARWFSVDTFSACAPGLYFGARPGWHGVPNYQPEYAYVRSRIEDIFIPQGKMYPHKIRTRRLEVIERVTADKFKEWVLNGEA